LTTEERLMHLIKDEFIQREQEGCDVTALRQEFEERTAGGEYTATELNELYDRLMALPIAADFPYDEPSDLSGIRRLREDGPRSLAVVLNEEQLFDRIYGAWLGRSAGCALGKPVEVLDFMSGKDGRTGYELIKEYLIGADAWPLDYYIPGQSRVEGLAVRSPMSQRENIKYMETDDDIRYTVLALKLLEEKGLNFTSSDVAMGWLNALPIALTFTAERLTYTNLANRMPAWGEGFTDEDLEYARLYRNPYREWIGAQIRVDGYAYAVPGKIELAAELAHRDASISHVKNGIYGAMFVAAMIAAAFAVQDPEEVVRLGLSEIPRTSRLYQDVTGAVALAKQTDNWDDLMGELWRKYGHYHPVHTNNNAALVAAALVYGGDDFEKCITTAVVAGWDTDCNGATVGSIWGAMYGAKALPQKWIEPLNDTLYSAIPDFHPIAISECAKRSTKLALDFAR